jgi:hypothetical protein
VRHDRDRQAVQRGRACWSCLRSGQDRDTARRGQFPCPAGSASCRCPGERFRRPVAAAELPGAGRAAQRRAVRPSACPPGALGVAVCRRSGRHGACGLGAGDQCRAQIAGGRAPGPGAVVAADRPGTGAGAGLGRQPAPPGDGERERGCRERAGPAAGRCHQRAVGLLLPRRARPGIGRRSARKGRVGRSCRINSRTAA